MDLYWNSILAQISNSNPALCRGILGENVLSAGSGPFREDDFDAMMLDCNIQPHAVPQGYRILIPGNSSKN